MPPERKQARLDVQLAAARPDDEAAVQAAIRLGNLARSTMGHMPFAGYRAAAGDGTLLLAYHGGRVVGYALYALARGRVRLTHLCVDPHLRRCGIATQLVERISELHADHLGISARCRHDYDLGRMWISLDFVQIDERPGRSSEGYPIVEWWRDHGHPNLFTADPEVVLVRAAVDLNVLRDLAEPARPDREESQALQADHLVGLLELARTAALNTEIDKMEGDLRARCTAQARSLTAVRADDWKVARITDELRVAAQQERPGFPGDEQDALDLRHVAEAIACDLNVLITRDRQLTRILGEAAQRHGLRIMRPGDVVIHIDELMRAEAYRPAALLTTSYTHRLIGAESDMDVSPLVNTAAGERPRGLIKTLRTLAIAGHDRVGIFSAEGRLAATFTVATSSEMLRVPLLRVADGPLADTLARQLLFHLRHQASKVGASVVLIADPYLSPQLRRAALNDGFHRVGDEFYGFALASVGPAHDIDYQVAAAARQAGLPEPPSLGSSMAAVVAAETERIWWPVKIIDSKLPTYLVPIRQTFSSRLLGVPPGLVPRPEVLGLSREHVYYRSPAGAPVEAPARLLWYASQGGPAVPEPPGIVACSHLDLVLTTTPDEAHSRFQHLGVWDKPTIQHAASDGKVQALRFINTEVLPHPIPRRRYQQLAREHGSPSNPPQRPALISADLFTAIYKEGRAK